MKYFLTICLSAFLLQTGWAQASTDSSAPKPKLYDVTADGVADIQKAIAQAKAENKFVLIQAGGNWCKWCIEFHRFSTTDPQIDSVINAGFIVYHLNFSKENKNEAAFKMLDFPQRFGFPCFIIVDGNGKRLHTQNSAYLEDGNKSYDKNEVQSFLEMWSPRALDPKMYGYE